eukprot:Tbor_TRINITY_DN6022_c0_g2::TRINITY_DN6022_c0_g2_i5::g.10624::m.10624/K10397/KIF6_9; kinesin family member 6/9
MGKEDRVHVFLRIRPNKERRGSSEEGYVIDSSQPNQSKVSFHVDRKKMGESDYANNSIEDYTFQYDKVFGPKATQDDIFNSVAKDCVISALDGYNSTIFAYGQTGSGKTYSITGGTESHHDRGIIPRSLSYIYDEVSKRINCAYTIRISYLQIYNDKGQDLLNNIKNAKNLEDLPCVSVHEIDDEVILRGLDAYPSNNIRDALNLLYLGDTNRFNCETPMNKTSSRSHCIFSVSIEARDHGSEKVRRSKLHFVDLAGSERVGKTGVQGTLLTEAKYINLSLHFLETVIVALSEQSKGKRDHIPFRNSFMTMCLRDSLGENCRTAMLATAHPGSEYIMETISTSRFAQRVACITQNARVNVVIDPEILIENLREEILKLNQELSHYRKGGAQNDREMSSDEYERCREIVQRFLNDPDPNSNPTDLDGDFARTMACFRIMKEMILKRGTGSNSVMSSSVPSISIDSRVGTANDKERSSSSPGKGVMDSKIKASLDALTLSLQQKENEISLLFNILEKSTAVKYNAQTQTGEDVDSNHIGGSGETNPNTPGFFGLINACHDSSGSVNAGVGGSYPQLQRQHQNSVNSTSSSLQGLNCPSISAAESRLKEERQEGYDLTILADADILKDRQAAFECFRKSYRKYEQIEKNKEDLKSRYDMCKSVAEEVNICVDRIKSMKVKVQRLRADRAIQGIDEPSQEEIECMQHLSEAKQKYSEKGQILAKEKEYIDHLHLIMRRSQEQLSKDFNEWFGLRQKQLQLTKEQMTLGASMKGGEDIVIPRSAIGRLMDNTHDGERLGEFCQQRPTNASLQDKGGSIISSSFTPSQSVSGSGTIFPRIPSSANQQLQPNGNSSYKATNIPLAMHPSSAPSSGTSQNQQQLRNNYLSSSVTVQPQQPPKNNLDNVYIVNNTITTSLMNGGVNLPRSTSFNQQQHPSQSISNNFTVTAAMPFHSTGDPVADQQLIEMHKAREEMRARRAQLQQLK